MQQEKPIVHDISLDKDRIVLYPTWIMVGLQHVSYLIVRLYFLISGTTIHNQITDLDKSKHYVMAANHIAWTDPFVITSAFGYRKLRQLMPCRFISANVFFEKLWLRIIMLPLGAFPAYAFKNYSYGLDASEKLITAGQTVAIFPQGKRTLDNTQPVKKGVGVLAQMESTLVIPVHIELRKRKLWLAKYHIIIGKPIDAHGWSAEQIMATVFALPR